SHIGWPKAVLLPARQSLNIRDKLLVGEDLYPFSKLRRWGVSPESVLPSRLGRARFRDQAFEEFFLHIMGILHEELNLMNALLHYPCQYRIDQSHVKFLSRPCNTFIVQYGSGRA